MSDKITIFDTTLRDGEHAAGVHFSRKDKLVLAQMLESVGVDVIEAGFPGASPGELENVRAVAEVLRNSTVCGLARAVPQDIDAVASALKAAVDPRIHVFINSSTIQIQSQLRKTGEEVLERTEAMVRRARNRTAQVEFSPMDATRAEPSFLAAMVRRAIAAGATVINIPDTVGCALPAQIQSLLEDLYLQVPELENVKLSFHGQDDLGMATANALTAISCGARQVELVVNGIGERAGNTSFEEVVMAIDVHGGKMGVHTDVKTEGLYRLSREVEARSGMKVPRNKAIVGGNAFRHASGIHQDGVLKERINYEVLDPARIGHPVGTQIVLGKLSGRAGFQSRIQELGFQMDEAELEQAFMRFQQVAEDRAEVSDEELNRICRSGEEEAIHGQA